MTVLVSATQSILRETVTTSGDAIIFPSATRYLQISNAGANALNIFFTLADFNAGTNYIDLAATTGFYGGPLNANKIWVQASGGNTTMIMVVYYAQGILG